MKGLNFITLLIFSFIGRGQTIFFESFSDADGTTAGTDDIGGVTWVSTCPYCGPSGDWNEVVSGVLEGADTNGPAFWETGDIDISTCTEGVTISLDLSHVSTLEGLPVNCAGGCNTTDIVKLEVSYDGGSSWTPYADAIYGTTSTATIACDCGTCGSPDTNYPVPWCGASIDGPTITVDDFTAHTFSDCISVGVSSTVRLRITMMTWAGAEKIRVDNVALSCTNCALPVEISSFNVFRTNKAVELNWTTLSETDNKVFHVQRSLDGILFSTIGDVRGKINSSETTNYSFTDLNLVDSKTVYYRLEQMDMNGHTKFSEIKTVHYTPLEIMYTDGYIIPMIPFRPNSILTLSVYDLSGQLIYSQVINENQAIPWTESGFFVVEIPELEMRTKLVVP